MSEKERRLGTRQVQNRDFKTGLEDICLLLEEVGSSTSEIPFSSKSEITKSVIQDAKAKYWIFLCM